MQLATLEEAIVKCNGETSGLGKWRYLRSCAKNHWRASSYLWPMTEPQAIGQFGLQGWTSRLVSVWRPVVPCSIASHWEIMASRETRRFWHLRGQHCKDFHWITLLMMNGRLRHARQLEMQCLFPWWQPCVSGSSSISCNCVLLFFARIPCHLWGLVSFNGAFCFFLIWCYKVSLFLHHV